MLPAIDLSPFRMQQDAVADALIADLVRDHDIQAANRLLQTLTRNYDIRGRLLPGPLGERLDQYLEATAPPPAWANPDAIRTAQRVFATNAVTIAMLLNFRSLPMAYSCANGSKVLYETGLLTARDGVPNLVRRLMETAQFVIYAMEPGGLSPGGRGILTTQKVRLIHASIRHLLITQRQWDHQHHGAPINQEDMAGTLLSFSALVLEGLEMSGYKLSREQKDAYIHCWNVVGHWLGLDERLMAPNYDEALQLGYTIFDQQLAPSPWGVQLAAALAEDMGRKVGVLLKPAVPVLIRYYCGNHVGDVLGIAQVPLVHQRRVANRIKLLSSGLQRAETLMPVLRWLLGKMSVDFLQNTTTVFNGFKHAQFYVPTYLTEGAEALRQRNETR
ncbi:oxygenase MpaB family protein [Fibrisoma limi]|nr:oxygenase MpaB family protein [Fibrisoma limi]